jgi:hypothetical protein
MPMGAYAVRYHPTETGTPTETPCPTTEPAHKRKPTLLATKLKGENEVPPADLDGKGTAAVIVSGDRLKVCYFISVSNLSSDVTAAHIHVGEEGANGPIVVPLDPPVDGLSAGCAAVEEDLGHGLATNPTNFYVNVHTTEFPGGAVRGQLNFASFTDACVPSTWTSSYGGSDQKSKKCKKDRDHYAPAKHDKKKHDDKKKHHDDNEDSYDNERWARRD